MSDQGPAIGISQDNTRLERWCLFALVFAHLWVLGVLPMDINGDPNDYLSLGKRMLDATPARSFGYPFFLRLLSFDYRSLFPIVLTQHILFLWAYPRFVRAMIGPGTGRAVAYLIACLPSIVYMQNLLFPDGLLCSLTLLFLVELAASRLKRALAMTIALVAIKPFFSFLLFILAARYLASRKRSMRGVNDATIIALGCVGLLLPFFATSPHKVFEQPTMRPREYGLTGYYPTGEISIDLGDRKLNVDWKEIEANANKYADPKILPLERKTFEANKITPSELLTIKKTIAWELYKYRPSFHLMLFAKQLWRTLLFVPNEYHLSYMLHLKQTLFESHLTMASYFNPESELHYFEHLGFTPAAPYSAVLYRIARFEAQNTEVLRFGIGSLALLVLLASAARGKLRRWLGSELARVSLIFVIVNAILLTSMQFMTVDRYLNASLLIVVVWLLSVSKSQEWGMRLASWRQWLRGHSAALTLLDPKKFTDSKTEAASRKAPPADHLDALTSIRGVLSFGVFAAHFSSEHDGSFPTWFGPMAVIWFFTLSGFILTYNFPMLRTWGDRGRFVVSRFWRMFPVQVATIALSLALFRSGFYIVEHEPLYLLQSLTLTHAWGCIPFAAQGFNGPAWSISIEWFFYLMFPLLIALSRPAALLLVVLCAASGFAWADARGCWDDIAIFTNNGDSFSVTCMTITHYWAPGRLWQFALGMAACGVATRLRGFARPGLLQTALLSLAVAAFYFRTPLVDLFSTSFAFRFYFSALVYSIICALVLIAFSMPGPLGKAFGNRVFVFFGEISFSLYMLHVIVMRFFAEYRLGHDLSTLSLFALVSLTTIALSSASYFGLEKPARDWLKRRLKKNRS